MAAVDDDLGIVEVDKDNGVHVKEGGRVEMRLGRHEKVASHCRELLKNDFF